MLFRTLDPVLHAPLRLAIVSVLRDHAQADFRMLREKTGASAGNLSVQLNKLKDAGYISIVKQFKDNYPQTLCSITAQGHAAFESYQEAIQTYMKPGISPALD
ncbi:MAG TPA: transcriptional regulator [Chitinophagaceae bacterium]|nr:transcriptional regulator [Chitinophagaceae bacterium]HRF26012.1 transcriptional regulator [Ferruginibacter sp.]